MKVVFWRSDKPLERAIARDFCKGLEQHGVEFEVRNTQDYQDPLDGTDVAVVVGVKGESKRIMQDHSISGMNTVYIDKGYIRELDEGSPTRAKYWRMSVNEFQPLNALFDEKRPMDRWKQTGRKLSKRIRQGDRVVFAGSSQKYCRFWRLGDATEYAKSVFFSLSKRTDRELVYRPKPSWANAVPIEGTTFSPPKIKLHKELRNAFALVTHGSNASLDALLAGVPVVALGPAVTKPISGPSLYDIEDMEAPTYEQRLQLCYNLAYWQYTHAEIRAGVAWEHLRQYFHPVEHY